MKIQIVVRPGTLAAIAEHTTAPVVNGAEPIDENRSLVELEHDVLHELLCRAHWDDKTIDDVLLRISR